MCLPKHCTDLQSVQAEQHLHSEDMKTQTPPRVLVPHRVCFKMILSLWMYEKNGHNKLHRIQFAHNFLKTAGLVNEATDSFTVSEDKPTSQTVWSFIYLNHNTADFVLYERLDIISLLQPKTKVWAFVLYAPMFKTCSIQH